MRPRLRKLALTAHVSSSVGWLGAVAASLALAVAGVAAEDPVTIRGAYVSLEVLGWYVLVPLSAASLFTGLVSSLGTTWGLFRHYWVLAKLAINVFAGIVLLMYMQSIDYLARVASASASTADVTGIRGSSPVLHAAGALLLLVIATVLGLYKPKGLTRYGWRKQHEQPALLAPQG
ncbi:MAG: DUF2269 domain-containing protein [Actinomycetota bacterium]|nr:DUF2269 domain-containing protein [Actinomycetota bacterium]